MLERHIRIGAGLTFIRIPIIKRILFSDTSVFECSKIVSLRLFKIRKSAQFSEYSMAVVRMLESSALKQHCNNRPFVMRNCID